MSGEQKTSSNQRQHSTMASSSVPSPKSINLRYVNIRKSGLTTLASLPRELRDQIYRYIVIAEDGPLAITGCAMKYGNGEGIKAIREVLHSSHLTARFAHEAYEVFFSQSTFQVHCDNLPEFLTRKSLYLKNEGIFSVSAWVGRLDVIVRECAYSNSTLNFHNWDRLGDELRQLLGCSRLHTVSLRIESPESKRFELDGRKSLCDLLNAIADVCAPLQKKMGRRFKVEVAGKDISWRQSLSS